MFQEGVSAALDTSQTSLLTCFYSELIIQINRYWRQFRISFVTSDLHVRIILLMIDVLQCVVGSVASTQVISENNAAAEFTGYTQR